MNNASVLIQGGLGNQMFQLAAAYVYAQDTGRKLEIASKKTYDDGRATYWDTFLQKWKPYLVETLGENYSRWIQEPATNYIPIPLMPNVNMYLDGYFQTYKYFEHRKDEIRQLFAPPQSLVTDIQKKYTYLLENRDRVVIVHARRTDYCKNPGMIAFHGPLTKEYYQDTTNLMLEIVKDPIFVLCSDDPTFWTSNLLEIPAFKNNLLYFLEGEDDIHTLTLFIQFQYFILANSSFSWWGAYLANPKQVFVPSKWFGPTGPKDYKDIYYPDWDKI